MGGFAVVFGLWLLWGYQLVRGLATFEQTISSAQSSYARGEQVLLRIRTNVLLGSIYVRDALIDGASPPQQYYRDELARLGAECQELLAGYLPQVSADAGRDEWLRLQTELGHYWDSRNLAFEPGGRTPREAAAVLRAQVVPRRQCVIRIVDQLSTLQSAANDRYLADVRQRYAQVRTRLGLVGAGTLFVALMAAGVASQHAYRLQRQLEQRRIREQDSRRDLERLSARLVAAQEEERRSLARELHDVVGQALTAVKMDIGIALRAQAEPRVRAALEEARDITETALHGVRDLSQLLHPSTLDDFGLPATLTAYVRSFSKRTGIRAQLVETLDRRLPPAVESGIYRIVQEALNNVATHSGAGECTVELSEADGTLRAAIDDNGRGFDPGPAGVRSPRGLGLIGMRERAQMLGGTFALGASASGGTRVEVIVPLPREPVAATDAQETAAPRLDRAV
jgi:signal transduction histidine kinase